MALWPVWNISPLQWNSTLALRSQIYVYNVIHTSPTRGSTEHPKCFWAVSTHGCQEPTECCEGSSRAARSLGHPQKHFYMGSLGREQLLGREGQKPSKRLTPIPELSSARNSSLRTSQRGEWLPRAGLCPHVHLSSLTFLLLWLTGSKPAHGTLYPNSLLSGWMQFKEVFLSSEAEEWVASEKASPESLKLNFEVGFWEDEKKSTADWGNSKWKEDVKEHDGFSEC